MKKINAKCNQKDRVICVTEKCTHKFYYKPVDSKERILLFATKFSLSVLEHFREKGRSTDGNGYEMTLREFYKFKDFHNYKLSKLMERIPLMIEYVIREYFTTEENNNSNKNKVIHNNIDKHEIAA